MYDHTDLLIFGFERPLVRVVDAQGFSKLGLYGSLSPRILDFCILSVLPDLFDSEATVSAKSGGGGNKKAKQHAVALLPGEGTTRATLSRGFNPSE